MQWTPPRIRLYSSDLGLNSEGKTSHVGRGKLLGCECLTEGCVRNLYSEVIYDLLTLPHWGFESSRACEKIQQGTNMLSFHLHCSFHLKCDFASSLCRTPLFAYCLHLLSVLCIECCLRYGNLGLQQNVSCKDWLHECGHSHADSGSTAYLFIRNKCYWAL